MITRRGLKTMRPGIGKKATVLLASLVLTMLATGGVATMTPVLPNPVLAFMGQEYFEANGKQWTRYAYKVTNLEEYPNELFASAPELPPCGQNTRSSRTWVDFYEQNGKRLYGFCALGNRQGLAGLWFVLERDVVPPSWIYIEMSDRKTGTKYKSNLAETTD
jgi:hypothetical protein